MSSDEESSPYGSVYSSGPYYTDVIRSLFNLTDGDILPTSQSDPESDIAYHPVSEDRSRQTRDLQNLQDRSAELPPGWPDEVSGVQAWEPHQLSESQEYLFILSPEHHVEIDRALQAVKHSHTTLDKITRPTFPLPTLGPLLAQIRDTVYQGIGFSVVRGLRLTKFGHAERAIVFVGIASYVAEERGPQDHLGTMIKHIMDDERNESIKELPFHTDVTCDVSALLTVKTSERGGEWTVASSFAVYNAIARTRPDLIRILATPDWPFDTFGREPAFYRRAPLYFHDSKPIFNFSRRLLVGHPKLGRTPGVPKLTEAQAEALDFVHFTAREHCVKFDMEEGDIRFISNFGLLHGREGFHDDNVTESGRHVMRLWLRNKDMAWKLPRSLQLVWARIFDDPDRKREWIIEPYMKNGKWYGRGPRAECD